MTVGRTPRQADVFRSTTQFVDELVGQDSIWAVLHRESHRLFPDDAFADLFQTSGRRSIPPRILAVVMVLQKALGLSDREAVAAFQFDIRWKYACGGLDFDYPGFVHTVLSGMRARLASSDDPDRIFNATVDVAKAAGLIGRKRVMDSAPIYDAVATQDTVTMIRSAIRGLLKIVDPDLKAELQAVLQRDDDYTTAGKPVCDWEDPDARIELVDALASDGHGCLEVLDGRELKGPVSRAARLLATVVGQDLETDADGRFVIARKVAKDRVISTVDPDARHGHKTSARGFDGYKGHIAEDPDSEIITNTTVTAGNVADGAVAEELLADILPTTTNNNSPDATDTGEPFCYAQFDADPDNTTIIIGPSPDAAYVTQLNYFFKPESLVDSPTGTWLSNNAYKCLLYGTLSESSNYLKRVAGIDNMGDTYGQEFLVGLQGLKNLGESRDRKDTYRSGEKRKAEVA